MLLNQYEVHNKVHQAEQMRQANRRRLVREALRGEGHRVRFYAPLMAQLGTRMINLGHALQRQYGEARMAAQVHTPSLKSL